MNLGFCGKIYHRALASKEGFFDTLGCFLCVKMPSQAVGLLAGGKAGDYLPQWRSGAER